LTTGLIRNPHCSIVIPAYNEERRIGPSLEKILAYVKRQQWDSKIIVVNDGSHDCTSNIVRDFGVRNHEIQLLENPGNRGKGYSVRHGMLHAKGDILLFTDADLSSPIEEAGKLFKALSEGADIAIGSRWLQSSLQTQPQSLRRQVLGRAFNLVPRLLLGLNYKDTQCGFKAFRRAAAEVIFPLQKIERWGFDPELLFLGLSHGFKVAEVPVIWAHSEGTRIRPIRDGLRMLGEMGRIRWYASTGQYALGKDATAEMTIAA
jgi:dolichyl-phosphate beta-glucosyltransferase